MYHLATMHSVTDRRQYYANSRGYKLMLASK